MKKFLYVLCFATIVLAPGCIGWLTDWWKGEEEVTKPVEKKEQPLKTITADQLRDRMKKVKELAVVNVLAEEVFNDCHIQGSINVPLDQLAEKAKWWSKEKEVVVYCASYECSASRDAYKILEEMGFTNIAAYEGGMKEWKEKKFETEGPCK